MFYPKCPKCGSDSESIESDTLDYGNRHTGQWLHSQAMGGHSHPWVKAASFAVSVGRQLYKRVPGGGAKRCTSPACRHEFN